MELGLAGKVAMVAAASKGIGRACAEALAGEGARVSATARHAPEVAGVELAMAADVTSAGDLARWHAETEARLGPVDVLVTNTGGPPAARFTDLDEATWRAGIDSTLMNVIRLCKLVIPGMRARRSGRIIHLTSFVARQPAPELTISSTLRAGLSALTKSMAAELGPDGITVNAVLMGHVRTARAEHLAEVKMKERGISRDEYYAATTADVPLRRMADPGEVGVVVAFLASARASYVSGVSLPVDGGLIRGTF